MSTIERTMFAVLSVLVVVVLAACGGTPGAGVAVDPPSDPIDELSLHDDQYCPRTMPRAPEETYGFGTEEPATELPAFPTFDGARLCAYRSQDVATQGSGGALYDWVRTGAPRKLTAPQMASFSDALGELTLIGDDDHACSDDLGPRYLVSLSWKRDLTGVVVDDYGCGSVRLTDDPFVTVPGDASQAGTVAGVLVAPQGLLADLGVADGR